MTTQVHTQSAFGLRLHLQVLLLGNLQGSFRQSCLCFISVSLFIAVRSNRWQGGALFLRSPSDVLLLSCSGDQVPPPYPIIDVHVPERAQPLSRNLLAPRAP
jgi:hypothetical protein